MAKHVRINKYAKIKKGLVVNSYQGKTNIGEKIIFLDFEVSHDEIDQIPPKNWACFNFCMRRDDFDYKFDKKTYYGHVDNLGYVIAEDELEELDLKDIKKLHQLVDNEMLYKKKES